MGIEFCIMVIVLTDRVSSHLFGTEMHNGGHRMHKKKIQPSRCIDHCHEEKWRQAENIYLNDLCRAEENNRQR